MYSILPKSHSNVCKTWNFVYLRHIIWQQYASVQKCIFYLTWKRKIASIWLDKKRLNTSQYDASITIKVNLINFPYNEISYYWSYRIPSVALYKKLNSFNIFFSAFLLFSRQMVSYKNIVKCCNSKLNFTVFENIAFF